MKSHLFMAHARTRRAAFCAAFVFLAVGCTPAVRVKNASAPAGQSVPPTGIWKVQDVPYAPWTLNLRAVGNTVTGTVNQSRNHGGDEFRFTTLTEPVEIYDGTIQGNTVSFKFNNPGRASRTITFTGEIKGDEIIFARTVEVRPDGYPGEDGIFGASGPSRFTAKLDSNAK